MAAPAKLLGQYTAKGVVGAQAGDSPSLEAGPGDDPAEYFDPLTGEVLQAPSARKIIEGFDMPTDPEADGDQATAVRGLVTKEALINGIETGNLSGLLKKGDGPEWDEWLIDLSAYPDPNAARRIIVDAAEHPDYKAVKNQGGGRFQTIEVKGQRGVIAWPVHRDQDGSPPHVQIFVHHHAVDGKTVRPRATIADSHVRSAEEAAINKKLAEAGLAPIAILTPTASMKGPQVQQAMRTVQQTALTGGPLPAPEVPASAPVNVEGQRHVLVEAARAKQVQSGKLYDAANEALNDSRMFEAAARALGEHDDLVRSLDKERGEKAELAGRLDEEQTRNTELEAQAGALEAQAGALEDQNDGLMKRVQAVETALSTERDEKTQALAKVGEVSALLDEERAARNTLSGEYDTLAGELETEREAHAATREERDLAVKDRDLERQGRIGAEAHAQDERNARLAVERERDTALEARTASDQIAQAEREAKDAALREASELRERLAAMEKSLSEERALRAARDAELKSESELSGDLKTKLAVSQNTVGSLQVALENEQQARKVSEKTARDAMSALRKLAPAPADTNRPGTQRKPK